MASYLVERYTPRLNQEDLVSLVARITAAVAEKPGASVQHLVSVLLPEEEITFSLFAAPNEGEVMSANESAGVAFDRITEVVLSMPEGMPAA